MFLHATCVAINDQGVLLVGPSGVGKSDLALRLIDGGAELVSDDQTKVCLEKGKLLASPPDKLAGMLEIRSVGLIRLPYRVDIEIKLHVELVTDPQSLERMPVSVFHSLLDCKVRSLRLAAYTASVSSLIRVALKGSFVDDV